MASGVISKLYPRRDDERVVDDARVVFEARSRWFSKVRRLCHEYTLHNIQTYNINILRYLENWTYAGWRRQLGETRVTGLPFQHGAL